ncbi:MAG: hypothetical protein ABFR97_10105 [Thermodesulfobacteriota bacterium]
MTEILLLTLKISVGAVIFAIGLGARLSHLTYLWRRPALLLRALIAMYLGVPLVAIIMVKVLHLPPGVEVGFLVLAVSAGAPLLPRKLVGIGRDEFVFSLVFTSTLLAIFTVPAWLAVLGPQFGSPAHLAPKQVSLIFAKSFFLPLLAGMVMGRLFPGLAARSRARLMGLSLILLAACALLLLVLHWRVIAQVHWQGILALAVFTLCALAIGHGLGGPAPEDRTALAIACATRHIGIAALVAASLPGPKTAVIIVVYILTAGLIAIPYLRWRRLAQ